MCTYGALERATAFMTIRLVCIQEHKISLHNCWQSQNQLYKRFSIPGLPLGPNHVECIVHFLSFIHWLRSAMAIYVD